MKRTYSLSINILFAISYVHVFKWFAMNVSGRHKLKPAVPFNSLHWIAWNYIIRFHFLLASYWL